MAPPVNPFRIIGGAAGMPIRAPSPLAIGRPQMMSSIGRGLPSNPAYITNIAASPAGAPPGGGSGGGGGGSAPPPGGDGGDDDYKFNSWLTSLTSSDMSNEAMGNMMFRHPYPGPKGDGFPYGGFSLSNAPTMSLSMNFDYSGLIPDTPTINSEGKRINVNTHERHNYLENPGPSTEAFFLSGAGRRKVQQWKSQNPIALTVDSYVMSNLNELTEDGRTGRVLMMGDDEHDLLNYGFFHKDDVAGPVGNSGDFRITIHPRSTRYDN